MAESYTVLMTSIIHSTVWDMKDSARIVWITMLALADRDGLVRASIPGLAHAARVSENDVEEALKAFTSPDPRSRSQECEGRRVVEAEGGWWLVNHGKYRPKRNPERRRVQNREAQARLRERRSVSQKVSHVSQISQNQPGQPESARISPSTPTPTPDPDQKQQRAAGAAPCRDCAKVIAHLNARAQRAYEPGAKILESTLHRRHKQHGVDACLDVTDYLIDLWAASPTMRDNIRPATLYNARVFEGRLADIRERARRKSG